jgi:desulfoferrodoxin (superoxide reductase-like protein)
LLYFLDDKQHHRPHIHVKYQDEEAVVSIPEGELLEGHIPPNKIRLALAWIEIHKDDLVADGDLAVHGQQPYKIEPLR